MAEPKRIPFMSVEDYLKFEETSQVRHEYLQGQLFAMTGATECNTEQTAGAPCC
jgi:Uma2 family endonuclease